MTRWITASLEDFYAFSGLQNCARSVTVYLLFVGRLDAEDGKSSWNANIAT